MTVSNSKTFQFPEVRVVEASAGSGKTYALAKRYIQLLLHPSLKLEQIPIRNILAITFTNKAAFEMKARILEFLKIIALGKLSQSQEKEILEGLGISRDQAKSRAFMIMEDLIRHYNFFQVQTIDKFINALLSGCAFKIGLTSNFKIKTNSKEYLEYSLDQLLDLASQDKKVYKIFEQFLHNYLYLENRTGWFPKQDMLGIICQLFMQSNVYGLAFKESPYNSEDLIKQKKKILRDMKELKGQLPEKTDQRFVKGLTKFLEINVIGFDVDSISDYFTREQVPVRKEEDVPKEVEKLWTSIQKGLRQVCEREACSLFNPYIQVYNYVQVGLSELSAKDDVLFLEELNKKAGALFDEDYVTVEELYYRLATRFHHYLIDEFQDTSRLQWQNLHKMTEEALSTGGSLFYVGDRKQAIYGFRGGEVDLFDGIKQEFNHFNVQVDVLTNNWRSQKAIVEFNNHIFSSDNLKQFIHQKEEYEQEKKKKNVIMFGEEDLHELDHLFHGSQQTFQPKNKDGYVRVEYIDKDKKEERDQIIREKLIHCINGLKKRFSYRDIAILTRSNKDVEVMTNWLLEDGILVESERTSDVRENPLIKELVALLRFLSSPIDNVAFASFVLGDIFPKATGIKSQELHDFVFHLRKRLAHENDLFLYTEFRQQYGEVWANFMDKFFKNVGLYPLYEFVVSIYNKFDCLRHFPQYQGYLMHFLELIKKYEEEYADIDSFLDYFEDLQGEDLYVHVTDSDAVKILTIHKSKGLEFPVVIIPYLGMDVQVGSGNDQKQSYIIQKSASSMELLRLKNKYLNFSDQLYQIYAKEYRKSLLSELNSIYVALTRPQKELYAFIPKRIGNSFNFVKFLVPEEIYQQGQETKYAQTKQEGLEIFNLPCSQYHDWIEYLKDEFHDVSEIQNRSKRLRGEVIHFMLSCVGNLSREDQLERIKYASQQVRLRFPQVEDIAEYTELLTELLKKKALAQIFYVEDGEVQTEKEIVNVYGHTKRLDRLIIKDTQVWIVDFKSSRDPQARYEEQMSEYIKMISELFPRHEVKGFIVFLDSFEMDEMERDRPLSGASV